MPCEVWANLSRSAGVHPYQLLHGDGVGQGGAAGDSQGCKRRSRQQASHVSALLVMDARGLAGMPWRERLPRDNKAARAGEAGEKDPIIMPGA